MTVLCSYIYTTFVYIQYVYTHTSSFSLLVCNTLQVCALCSALQDKNVLICRATLDVILTLFPLHRPFLLPSDIVLILSAALETLLRRDMSLNRRLYSWLLGTQVHGDNHAVCTKPHRGGGKVTMYKRVQWNLSIRTP